MPAVPALAQLLQQLVRDEAAAALQPGHLGRAGDRGPRLRRGGGAARAHRSRREAPERAHMSFAGAVRGCRVDFFWKTAKTEGVRRGVEGGQKNFIAPIDRSRRADHDGTGPANRHTEEVVF